MTGKRINNERRRSQRDKFGSDYHEKKQEALLDEDETDPVFQILYGLRPDVVTRSVNTDVRQAQRTLGECREKNAAAFTYSAFCSADGGNHYPASAGPRS